MVGDIAPGAACPVLRVRLSFHEAELVRQPGRVAGRHFVFMKEPPPRNQHRPYRRWSSSWLRLRVPIGSRRVCVVRPFDRVPIIRRSPTWAGGGGGGGGGGATVVDGCPIVFA